MKYTNVETILAEGYENYPENKKKYKDTINKQEVKKCKVARY